MLQIIVVSLIPQITDHYMSETPDRCQRSPREQQHHPAPSKLPSKLWLFIAELFMKKLKSIIVIFVVIKYHIRIV